MDVEQKVENRRVGVLVLVFMFAMAGLALWYALKTVPQRRGGDPAPKAKTSP